MNLDDLEKRVKAMNDQAVRGFVFCDFDERMAVAKFDQNAVVQMPCGSHVTKGELEIRLRKRKGLSQVLRSEKRIARYATQTNWQTFT